MIGRGRALPPDITVRAYHEDDRAQLTDFKCHNYSQKWTKAAQKVLREAPEAIADPAVDAAIVVAADARNRVVGAAVYGSRDGTNQIFSLGVVKDRRREGIGTGLKIAALADFAARGGRHDVFSQVHRRNDAMLGLNDKLGVARDKDPEDGEFWILAIAVEPEEDEAPG